MRTWMFAATGLALVAVTGLYFISAFAVNRVALFIEHRVQVPGMIGGGR